MTAAQPKRLQTVLPADVSVLLAELEKKLSLPTRAVLILAVQAYHAQQFAAPPQRGRPPSSQVSATLSAEDVALQKARARVEREITRLTSEPPVSRLGMPQVDYDHITGCRLPTSEDNAVVWAHAASEFAGNPSILEDESLRDLVDERLEEERDFAFLGLKRGGRGNPYDPVDVDNLQDHELPCLPRYWPTSDAKRAWDKGRDLSYAPGCIITQAKED